MKLNLLFFICFLVSYTHSSVQIVGGQISGDVYWTTDTIIVESDIYDLVYSHANLNITSSTVILNFGSKLTIFGSVAAMGTEFLMEDGENISIIGEASPLDSTIFIDCRFIAGTADSGGAISFIQSLKNRIENCYFDNNNAAFGGAISLYSSRCKIINSIFKQNNSSSGAAIHLSNNSMLSIDNSKFTSGSAQNYGGAICSEGSEGFYRNCIFVDNGAGISGGAIWSDDFVSRFINCTFYRNSSSGITSLYGKEVDVQNCLFAGRYDGTNEVDVPDVMFNTFRNNLVQDGSGPSDETNLSGNPKIGKGLFLLSDSPCIDNGTTYMGDFNGMEFPDNDYEGRTRVVGSNADIGAIEYDGIHHVAPVVVNSIPDQEVSSNSEFIFTIPESTFFDIDGDSVYCYVSGFLPSWLNFDIPTRTFTGTPENHNDSTFDIIVSFDDVDHFVYDTFSLHIVNTPLEVLNEIVDQEIHNNSVYSFTIPDTTFYDAEDSIIHYMLVSGPLWLKFSENERLLHGTPVDHKDTTFQIILAAFTMVVGNSALDTFALHVINDVPIVLNGIPDQEIHNNDSINYKIPDSTFFDPDDIELWIMERSQLPLWLALSHESSGVYLRGVPRDHRDTTFQIIIEAFTSVEGNSVQDTFNLHVINDVPIVLNPILDQEVHNNDTLKYSIPGNTFLDADDELFVELDPNHPSWLSLTYESTGIYLNSAPVHHRDTTIELILKAYSLVEGNEVSDTFALHVINDVPVVLNPILDQEVHNNDTLKYSIPGNTFLDADDELFVELDPNHPSWLSLTYESAGIYLNSAPVHHRDTTIELILKAYSLVEGNEVSDTFTLHVINDAPVVLNQIPNHIIINNSEFNFTIPDSTFHDNESSVILNTPNLPAWLSFDVSNNTLSGTPNVYDDTILNIIVNAYDDVNQSVSDTFMITVEIPNSAPIITPVNDTTIIVGTLVSWQIKATDNDVTDVLSYSLQEQPASMTINENDGLIEWFGDEDFIGVNSIIIQVIDNKGGMSLDTFEVTVDYPVKVSDEITNRLSKRIKIAPNPVKLNDDFIGFYLNAETIIQGKYDIYDILGNLLHSHEFVSDGNNFAGKWDLTNKNYRKISSGTYSVIFTIYQNDGSIMKIKKTIGVKEAF